MTLVWYPWTEGDRGPAGTAGAFRTLDLHLNEVEWPRLPGVGETIFFADGGSADVERVGWKLDGTAYLYLGNRYEKRGELLQTWLARGFSEREPQAPTEPAQDAAAPTEGGADATAPGAGEQPDATRQLPPMPSTQ